jgi:glycosyltransferase involved in cell wall biosynthesis
MTLSRLPRDCPIRPVRGVGGRRAGDHYGDAIPTAALLSFRLGGSDGVAVEAAKWQGALARLGFATVTVAGDGPVDHLLPGLAIGADDPPTRTELDSALASADLVVVENLCSLPLNPAAAAGVAAALAGRPAVLHHHDLPWQRAEFVHHPPPPADPRWRHVTINELSRRQLANRGLAATTIYNAFEVGEPGRARIDPGREDAGARDRVRRDLGVGPDERLVLQPTRAIPRKNVAGGMEVATRLGAAYWLLGPAEDGYDDELDALVAAAGCRVLLGTPGGDPPLPVHHAYQACEVVTLPSTWEGFGNPTIESVVHRRPLAIGPYPVAAELAAFGFDWFGLDETGRLAAWLENPDPGLLDRNLTVARTHFSLRRLPERIAGVLPAW